MLVSESDAIYRALEPVFPPASDPGLMLWRASLRELPPSKFRVRQATEDPADARRLKDLQLACEPITVQSVRDNATTITDHLVLLAEISGVHVGFSVASIGQNDADPTFVQVVAVAPSTQRRGVGLTLLSSVAERAPQQDIAFATRDDNDAALALTKRFTELIGATMRAVPKGTYRHRDLGTARGMGYRPWVIQRARSQHGR